MLQDREHMIGFTCIYAYMTSMSISFSQGEKMLSGMLTWKKALVSINLFSYLVKKESFLLLFHLTYCTKNVLFDANSGYRKNQICLIQPTTNPLDSKKQILKILLCYFFIIFIFICYHFARRSKWIQRYLARNFLENHNFQVLEHCFLL